MQYFPYLISLTNLAFISFAVYQNNYLNYNSIQFYKPLIDPKLFPHINNKKLEYEITESRKNKIK